VRFWPFRRREARSIDKMALWGTGELSLDEIHAGVPVSRETAARLVAVYACVRLRAETISGLPAGVFRRRGDERERVEPGPEWLRQPNNETTWFEFIERVNTSLDFDGNAFVLIAGRDRLGFARELWTLHPDEIQIRREKEGLVYVWGGSERLSRFDGVFNPLGDVLHIKNVSWGSDRAPSPIGVARQAIGLGIAIEKFGARFFGGGQQLSGVIELPATSPELAQEFAEQIREYWQSTYGGSDRSHLPGILTGGAKWTPISINPEEAQFLETRKFQVAEIARLYGIPPHMIGDVERSTSWGSGIEQQSIGFVQFAIGPRLSRLEAAFDQLTPRGQFIKWNVNGLLRGDARSRAEFYAKGIQWGYLLRSDARRFEDLPQVEGLDRPLIPANMIVLGEKAPIPLDVPVIAAGSENGRADSLAATNSE